MEHIFDSIKIKDNKVLDDYLKLGDINIINEHNESLLHFAIKFDNEYVFKRLIENYINLNIQDDDGNTPLNLSIILNKFSFFKQLVKAKANLNLANKQNESPLFVALFNNKIEMVKILFEQGVDLKIKNNKDENIYFAIVRSHNLELLNLFLKYDDNYLQSKNYVGNTLLHQSVMISDYNITLFLLQNGVLPNVVNNFKETPMFYAVRNEDFEIISLLIQYGALLDIENSFFETIYDIATTKTLEYLNFKEVSVEYLRYIKKYPFHCAVLKNDYLKVKQLISVYNVNKKDNFNNLAIDYAKKLNYLEIVKLIELFIKSKKK